MLNSSPTEQLLGVVGAGLGVAATIGLQGVKCGALIGVTTFVAETYDCFDQLDSERAAGIKGSLLLDNFGFHVARGAMYGFFFPFTVPYLMTKFLWQGSVFPIDRHADQS